MALLPYIKFSLHGGVVSKRMAARADQNKYLSCVDIMRNFIPLTLGGAKRRPGWRFVARAKWSGITNNHVVLFPFKFSNEQVYIVEVGHKYMRFYRGGERIENPPGTPIELATPYLNADLYTLSRFQSADVLYITHELYFTRKLSRTALDAFVLQTVQFNPPATVEHQPTGAELTGVGGGGGIPPPEG